MSRWHAWQDMISLTFKGNLLLRFRSGILAHHRAEFNPAPPDALALTPLAPDEYTAPGIGAIQHFRGSALFETSAIVFLVLWLLLVLGHGLAQARKGS